MLHALGTPRLGNPVTGVEETPEEAWITTRSGSRERYDFVVLACHADQSLALLKNPNSEQKRLLSPFRYQHNEALLHSDSSVMPRCRRAWASWNFKLQGGPESHRQATTHYWMNALQGVSRDRDYFVSLNSSGQISHEKIHYRTDYEHPIFTLDALRAQRELPILNRTGRIFFCGSYFRYGFHEDACAAGFDAAAARKVLSKPAP